MPVSLEGGSDCARVGVRRGAAKTGEGKGVGEGQRDGGCGCLVFHAGTSCEPPNSRHAPSPPGRAPRCPLAVPRALVWGLSPVSRGTPRQGGPAPLFGACSLCAGAGAWLEPGLSCGGGRGLGVGQGSGRPRIPAALPSGPVPPPHGGSLPFSQPEVVFIFPGWKIWKPCWRWRADGSRLGCARVPVSPCQAQPPPWAPGPPGRSRAWALPAAGRGLQTGGVQGPVPAVPGLVGPPAPMGALMGAASASGSPGGRASVSLPCTRPGRGAGSLLSGRFARL